MDFKSINVLVLGGTVFMGRSLLFKLSADPNCNIHIINRMKFHWDDELKEIPNITWVYGDRNNQYEYGKQIKYHNKKHGFSVESGKKWDLVIDFCGYERKDIKPIIEGLGHVTRLFVFISSDSVYDVSDNQKLVHDHLERIKEESAIRPDNDKEIRRLAKEEDYGHGKLCCEEYLLSHNQMNELPYVILRLPDVIGPFDGTYRLWLYIKWILFNQQYPIHLDSDSETKKLSFVYSEDVVEVLYKIAKKMQSTEDDYVESFIRKINKKSINLCFNETLTLKEFLDVICTRMQADNVKFLPEKELYKSGHFFLPSVECGPISNELAKELFDFEPTELYTAINATVDFFMDANINEVYNKEHRACIEKFQKVVSHYTNNKGRIILNNNKMEIVTQNTQLHALK